MEKVNILIPQSANYQLPDDSLLSFYEGIENRIFWVSDEISVYSLSLIHYILKWNMQDKDIPVEERKPIKLLFFSPGGDLDVYRSLADVISLSKTPVIGINMGIAYSAASMIFLSCRERYMLKSSSLLFHCGSSTMSGGFNEMVAAMEKYKEDISELSEIIQATSDYSIEEILQNMTTDWYIDAQEAFEHGICTKVVESIEDIIF